MEKCEFEKLLIDTFGPHFVGKVGKAEDNKIFGQYWTFPAGGQAGSRKEIPLTVTAARNIYGEFKSPEELASKIQADRDDPGFGADMSREKYIRARLIMAIQIAETPGSDGWHDGGPRVYADDALESECKAAILQASLEVGGRLCASDPYHTGVIDGLARMLSDTAPSPDYAARMAADHARFLSACMQKIRH